MSRLIGLTRAAAGLMLFGLLLCVAAGVVSRYLFNAPLTFTDEIAGYLFAGASLLGMAVTAYHGGHINVDLLSNRSSATARRRIDVVHWIVSVVFVGILFASGWHFFLNALNKGLRAPTVLQTPVALVGILFPIAMALFVLERIFVLRGGRPRVPTDSGGAGL